MLVTRSHTWLYSHTLGHCAISCLSGRPCAWFEAECPACYLHPVWSKLDHSFAYMCLHHHVYCNILINIKLINVFVHLVLIVCSVITRVFTGWCNRCVTSVYSDMLDSESSRDKSGDLANGGQFLLCIFTTQHLVDSARACLLVWVVLPTRE